MRLRSYTPADLDGILDLFYNTVHFVNCRDYSPVQLDAWAPAQLDRAQWASSLAAHATWVAELEGQLVGFTDLDTDDGYLDRLYVHKDYQRCGVATALYRQLEQAAQAYGLPRLYTEASLTARPFFLSQGFRVVREQQKPLRGQLFHNTVMEKMLEGSPWTA